MVQYRMSYTEQESPLPDETLFVLGDVVGIRATKSNLPVRWINDIRDGKPYWESLYTHLPKWHDWAALNKYQDNMLSYFMDLFTKDFIVSEKEKRAARELVEMGILIPAPTNHPHKINGKNLRINHEEFQFRRVTHGPDWPSWIYRMREDTAPVDYSADTLPTLSQEIAAILV